LANVCQDLVVRLAGAMVAEDAGRGDVRSPASAYSADVLTGGNKQFDIMYIGGTSHSQVASRELEQQVHSAVTLRERERVRAGLPRIFGSQRENFLDDLGRPSVVGFRLQPRDVVVRVDFALGPQQFAKQSGPSDGLQNQ
jgi:hypothetical protein